MNKIEKIGLIVSKNDEKRLAYAAVSVPGEADSDGEILTAGEIEHAAHKWMERYQNVDSNHDFQNIATPVESYILPMPMTVKAFNQELELPEGTWIVASRITDEQTWEAVKAGELRGHSVTAVRATKSDDPSFKKTLIRDLGTDWEAATVSIVDTPAVPKALFFAIKNQDESLKVGRRISNATMKRIQDAFSSLQDLINTALVEREPKEQIGKSQDDNMELDEIKTVVKEAIKEETDALWAELTTKEEDAEPEPVEEVEDVDPEPTEAEKALTELAEEVKSIKKMLGTPEGQSLKGQDGQEPPEPAVKDIYTLTGRDAFGRVIKKGE